MKLLPIHPALSALLPSTQPSAAPRLPEADLADHGHTPPDAAAPDWRSALLRLRQRAQDEETLPAPAPAPERPAEPLALLPPLALTPRPVPPEAPAPVSGLAPATPTTRKIDALRQLADAPPAAVPVARAWQVELPGAVAGAAWQLHVEQAQPKAPLTLVLQVPPAAQAQARQQLGELDKRLRDAGHDVLRPRVTDARSGKRFPPLDEVAP